LISKRAQADRAAVFQPVAFTRAGRARGVRHVLCGSWFSAGNFLSGAVRKRLGVRVHRLDKTEKMKLRVRVM
jgi:hypothetical protein